jgi:hypothetical protein
VEVIPQLDRDYVIRRYAYAAGVRQTWECEQLRIEFSKVEANELVLQSHNSLHTLTRRLPRSGVEGLMDVCNTADP